MLIFHTAHQSLVEVLLSPVGGILTNKATFEEGPREKTHVRHPSADLLSSYDLSRLKSKLGFGMNWLVTLSACLE